MKRTMTLMLLSLACLMTLPTVAQAGYADGMNLYEYVRSAPPHRRDSSGSKSCFEITTEVDDMHGSVEAKAPNGEEGEENIYAHPDDTQAGPPGVWDYWTGKYPRYSLYAWIAYLDHSIYDNANCAAKWTAVLSASTKLPPHLPAKWKMQLSSGVRYKVHIKNNCCFSGDVEIQRTRNVPPEGKLTGGSGPALALHRIPINATVDTLVHTSLDWTLSQPHKATSVLNLEIRCRE